MGGLAGGRAVGFTVGDFDRGIKILPENYYFDNTGITDGKCANGAWIFEEVYRSVGLVFWLLCQFTPGNRCSFYF